jgi:hypothetical protein
LALRKARSFNLANRRRVEANSLRKVKQDASLPGLNGGDLLVERSMKNR